MLPFGGFWSTDATGKVSAQGLPLLVAVTVDARSKGHWGTIMLSSHEGEAAYAWKIQRTKEHARTALHKELLPAQTCGDHAEAIHNACQANFTPDCVQSECFPHLARNARLKLRAANVSKRGENAYLSDLKIIRRMRCRRAADAALALLRLKYAGVDERWEAGDVTGILGVHDGLAQTYYTNPRWMMSRAQPGCPTHQNHIESMNWRIKAECTYGRRVGPVALLTNVARFLGVKSALDAGMSGEPDIPRAVWADAQAMLSSGWFGLKQKMAGSSKRPSYLALTQSGGLARALAAGREARGGTESQARRKQQSKHQSKHSNQQQPEQEGAAAEARAQKRSAAAEFERCLCAATQGTLDGIIRCYHGCVTITQLDCSAATEHIRYECSCWEFTAWLRCKHPLAASIASGVCVPVEFNTEAPVGRQRVGRPPNAERVWPAAGGSKGSSSSSKQ